MQVADGILCLCLSLIGGLCIPCNRFLQIPVSTFSLVVHQTDHHLCICVILFRRFLIPLKRFSLVLLNTNSTVISVPKVIFSLVITIFSSFGKPFELLFFIFLHYVAPCKYQRQSKLRLDYTLFSCLDIPIKRLCPALRYAFTLFKKGAEIVLCERNSLHCRPAIPFNRFRCITPNTFALEIHIPKKILRCSQILLRCLSVPFGSFCFILLNTVTVIAS